MATQIYGYDFWYHSAGDAPCTRSIPLLISGYRFDTHGAAELAAATEGAMLQTQGYVVDRCEIVSACASCTGQGVRYVRPKGWRKNRPCPSFMLKTVPCQDCNPTTLTGGRGR